MQDCLELMPQETLALNQGDLLASKKQENTSKYPITVDNPITLYYNPKT